jgi:hypothetical protein
LIRQVYYHPKEKMMTQIPVKAGGSLQAALDAARPGDEVILEAGATFEVNALLRPRDGTAPVTLTSSRAAEIPAGVRVKPEHAPLMARIITPNVAPVLSAPVGSHHWRIQCLEFTQGNVPVDSGAGYAWGYNLIQLGDGDTAGSQKTLESVPHHLEFDRCYIHPKEGAYTQRGITLNSASTSDQVARY